MTETAEERSASASDSCSSASTTSSTAFTTVSSSRAAAFSLFSRACRHASVLTTRLSLRFQQERTKEVLELAALRASIEARRASLLEMQLEHAPDPDLLQILQHIIGAEERVAAITQQRNQNQECTRAKMMEMMAGSSLHDGSSSRYDAWVVFEQLAMQMGAVLWLTPSEVQAVECMSGWLLEADDLLMKLAAHLSPAHIRSSHGLSIATCAYARSFHLLPSLLRRSGLTLGDVPHGQSTLFDLASEPQRHVVDYTPLLQLIRKQGLDGASRQIKEKKKKKKSTTSVGEGDPEEATVKGGVAAAAASTSTEEADSDSTLTAAQLARRFVRDHPSPWSTRAPPIAQYNGAMNLVRAFATQQAEEDSTEEKHRRAHLHARFMHQLAATWHQHSQSVRELLLQAAPAQLIPDLVNICAEYLDLDPPERRQ